MRASLMVVSALCWLAGCASDGDVGGSRGLGRNSPAVGTASQQQRVIPNAPVEEVLQVAAAALQREFGRVEIDRANGRITTAHVEFVTDRSSGAARDWVGGRSVMRRAAVFNATQSGANAIARLRIDVERRDTERQAATPQPGYVFGDTPGTESPSMTGVGTTDRQNAVWTPVRRDYTLERALLGEVREHFARLSPEATADVATTQPASGGPTSLPSH